MKVRDKAILVLGLVGIAGAASAVTVSASTEPPPASQPSNSSQAAAPCPNPNIITATGYCDSAAALSAFPADATAGSPSPAASSSATTNALGAAETAFATAENLRYALYAPPDTSSVDFTHAPVVPAVANSTTAYSSSTQSEMLTNASNRLANVMSPTLASKVTQDVSSFISRDTGSNIDYIGGEGADVLAINSASLSGDTVSITALERVWTKDGNVASSGKMAWTLIDSHENVTATMQQGSDGVWREVSQSWDFAPGWQP